MEMSDRMKKALLGLSDKVRKYTPGIFFPLPMNYNFEGLNPCVRCKNLNGAELRVANDYVQLRCHSCGAETAYTDSLALAQYEWNMTNPIKDGPHET